jgi:hypothetical protein
LKCSEQKEIMTISKEKISENVQVNFNHSKEIAYWSKKFNISASTFQKTFEQSGYSIPKTLQLLQTQP